MVERALDALPWWVIGGGVAARPPRIASIAAETPGGISTSRSASLFNTRRSASTTSSISVTVNTGLPSACLVPFHVLTRSLAAPSSATRTSILYDDGAEWK